MPLDHRSSIEATPPDPVRIVADRLQAQAAAYPRRPIRSSTAFQPSVPAVAAAATPGLEPLVESIPSNIEQPSGEPAPGIAPGAIADQSVQSQMVARPGLAAISAQGGQRVSIPPPESRVFSGSDQSMGAVGIAVAARSPAPNGGVEPRFVPNHHGFFETASSQATPISTVAAPSIAAFASRAGIASNASGWSVLADDSMDSPAEPPGVEGHLPISVQDVAASPSPGEGSPAMGNANESYRAVGSANFGQFAGAEGLGTGGSSDGNGGSSNSMDLARTNDLLQQILDALRKPSSFSGTSLPVGGNAFYAERC